jgi:hypothetical protein
MAMRKRLAATDAPGWYVMLTRVAPRKLDFDNLTSSLKAARDEVAKQLGFSDDNDARLQFDYSQEKGAPKEYAVKVTLIPNSVPKGMVQR